jgi:phosphonate transport system substrate-binding protein
MFIKLACHPRLLVFISALFSLFFVSNSLADKAKPLVFGLLPSESAASKFHRYAPLRIYLSEQLGREVILETARDFKTFTQRTKSRQYDFLETAPHFILPAVDSGKYRVITTINKPLTAQVVVRNDSKLKTISDMDNLVVATPSAKAIITKIGKEAINNVLGVKSKHLAYVEYATHNAAYQAVEVKNADAALISINIFKKALKNNVPIRSIGESEPIPNMSILVAADLEKKFARTLQKTLVDMKNTESGQQVLKVMSYPGYRKTSIKEFEVLKKYRK